MNRTVAAFVLAFASFAGSVSAHGPVETLDVPALGGALTYQHLSTEVSAPGETLDAFVVRIAPVLRAYTRATGYEACGVLASDGERFAVVVGSNLSHAACGTSDTFVPSGFSPVGQTLHSHRTGGTYRANESDRTLMGGRVGANFKSSAPDEFSPHDFHAPGYLVGARGVWHQEGRRAVRRVGAL